MPPFGRKTPPGVTFTCVECGLTLSPHALGTAREVHGWVVNRKAGGANHVRSPQPTGRFAHAACLTAKGSGDQQQALF